MGSASHAHPAEHSHRQIEEDVLAVPFVAWLGIVGTILIVASVFGLTGLYYQTQHALNRERAADAESRVTPAEAKVKADKVALNGYYRIPDPNPPKLDADGKPIADPDARTYVSIPVAEGKKKVLEQFSR